MKIRFKNPLYIFHTIHFTRNAKGVVVIFFFNHPLCLLSAKLYFSFTCSITSFFLPLSFWHFYWFYLNVLFDLCKCASWALAHIHNEFHCYGHFKSKNKYVYYKEIKNWIYIYNEWNRREKYVKIIRCILKFDKRDWIFFRKKKKTQKIFKKKI